MIVDCAMYVSGDRVGLSTGAEELHRALERCRGSEGFVWIGLHEPSVDQMQHVARVFDLHPLAVEDAVVAHQRPKLELYGEHDEQVFMVLKTLWYVDADDQVETGEVAVFLGDSYVVTVRHGEGSRLSTARHHLERHPARLEHGPSSVLHAVCDGIVDHYDKVADELQIDVDEVELSVFGEDASGSDSQRIYTLKRELAEFRRAVQPLRAPLGRLAGGSVPGVDEAAADFFRDIADHAVRIHETVDALDNLLSTAHDAYMARVSVQQNDDMRKISAWVAMAAVPTMIAGVYGMNFDHMPELHWSFGYYLIAGVMMASVVGLYAFFKKSGWL